MKCALYTPYLSAERGNSITARRIIAGLTANGIKVAVNAFCEKPATFIKDVDIIHGFHAYYFGRDVIENLPIGIPFILSLTGTDYNLDLFDPSRREIVQIALNRADRIVVFHQAAKEIIVNQLPCYNSKIEIIPPAIDLIDEEYIAEIPGVESWEQVVLIVAGLRKVKNVNAAIEAVKKARHKGIPIKLVHIGPIIEQEVYQTIRTQLLNNSWFISLGEVSHKLMAKLYRRSSIVINTSLSEAIPNSILEAMYCRRPVIVSKIPGNLAVIHHNLNGLVYNTEEELAEQIIMLIKNKNLAEKLGQNAGHYVRSNFNTKAEIAAYAKLYNETTLVSRRG